MRRVTAWDLVAYFGTGGGFQARRPGGRVVWTDARRVGSDDAFVMLGRVVPVDTPEGARLRVYETRVPFDAPLDISWGEPDVLAEIDEAIAANNLPSQRSVD